MTMKSNNRQRQPWASRALLAALLAAFGLFISVTTPAAQTGIPSYEVTFIGDLIEGIQSGTAEAVNKEGDVAGSVSLGASFELTSFLYLNNGTLVLLPRPDWAVTAWALDVSDRRPDGTIDIVGYAAPSIYSGDLAIRWRYTLADGAVEMTELGTLESFVQSRATAVNTLGDIVGYSAAFMQFGGPATLFTETGAVEIPTSPYTGAAVDITDDRWVMINAGYSASRVNLDTLEQIVLGVPEGRYYGSDGAAINTLNQVAATVYTGNTDPRGFYYSQVWRFTEGVGWKYLFGGGSSIDGAIEINLGGDVIGQITAGLSHYSIIYIDAADQAFIISDLLAEPNRGTSVGARGINDAGQLAGAGPGGPVLLTPLGETPPPTAPVDLNATLLPESMTSPNGLIRVEWTNTSDLTKTTEVERMPGPDGEPDFTPIRLSGNGTDGIVTLLTLGTTYTYRVYACGVAGCSPYSNTASATTRNEAPDIIPPEVSILKPNNGTEVSGDVAIEVLASDNKGVDYILVTNSPFKGSDVICEAFGTDTASCIWKTKKLDAGNYTITALAEDLSGNRSETSVTIQLAKAPKGGGKGKGRK